MINKVILMGRLTRDPELRATGNGTGVCNFSVAVDSGYGENKRADFINCVAWSKTAEFVKTYFSKGKMIIVEGRLQSRSWEDARREKRYVTEVIAEKVNFGETKGSGQAVAAENAAPYSAQTVPSADEYKHALEKDNDLPF